MIQVYKIDTLEYNKFFEKVRYDKTRGHSRNIFKP